VKSIPSLPNYPKGRSVGKGCKKIECTIYLVAPIATKIETVLNSKYEISNNQLILKNLKNPEKNLVVGDAKLDSENKALLVNVHKQWPCINQWNKSIANLGISLLIEDDLPEISHNIGIIIFPIEEKLELQVPSHCLLICFGRAKPLLDIGRVIPDFGLRYMANIADYNRIVEVASKEIQPDALVKKISSPVPTSFSKYKFEAWADMLTGLKAYEKISDDVQGTYQLAGSIGLRLKIPVDKDKFIDSLSKLSKIYFKCEEYKEHFEFIDWIRPLERSTRRMLDRALPNILKEDQNYCLEVEAYFPDLDDINYQCGNNNIVNYDGFKNVARNSSWQIGGYHSLHEAFKEWNVCSINSDNNYKTIDEMLSCLVKEDEIHEIENGTNSRIFLYRNCAWYEITKTFFERLDETWDNECEKGHKIFHSLQLPHFNSPDIESAKKKAKEQSNREFTDERAYNSLIPGDLLDGRCPESRGEKIEYADVGSNKLLIHTKIASSNDGCVWAATQALRSAKALLEDPDYLNKCKSNLNQSWLSKDSLKEAKIIILLVVDLKNTRSINNSIVRFHILQAINELNSMGFQSYLCISYKDLYTNKAIKENFGTDFRIKEHEDYVKVQNLIKKGNLDQLG